MRAATSLIAGGAIALALVFALGGRAKIKQSDPIQAGKARVEAKRQQAACGSSAAYDRLKGLLFDQAIDERDGDRANLDTLADYSLARMEEPVVKGWDPALDITRCKGRFILQIPPGAERAFGGEHRLQATIDYTAQAAADGNGFVYQLGDGAKPIVARLAAFNLTSGAYRPPPAIDEGQSAPDSSEPTVIAQADVSASLPDSAPARSEPAGEPEPLPPERRRTFAPERNPERAALEPRKPLPASSTYESGEGAVRAFYDALGTGDGTTASAQIIPEKRSSRAFSPEGLSRFYGALPEPIRITDIVPLARGAYRVSYRYSAGRSRCNGSAVVRLTNRGGRDFIRAINALNGC